MRAIIIILLLQGCAPYHRCIDGVLHHQVGGDGIYSVVGPQKKCIIYKEKKR